MPRKRRIAMPPAQYRNQFQFLFSRQHRSLHASQHEGNAANDSKSAGRNDEILVQLPRLRFKRLRISGRCQLLLKGREQFLQPRRADPLPSLLSQGEQRLADSRPTSRAVHRLRANEFAAFDPAYRPYVLDE